MIQKKAKENQYEGINQYSLCQKSDKPTIDTKKEVAKIAGVSHDTVSKYKKVKEEASPELLEQVKKEHYKTCCFKRYDIHMTHKNK